MPTKTRRKPKYHSILKLPPLPPDQLDALRENIAANGIVVPIVVDSDGPRRGIIDGSYRKRISMELAYDCPEIVMPNLDDQEKRMMARALNLARRQMNTEQKRQVIAGQLQETPGKSLRWIAKMLGVHHTTVGSVREEMTATGDFSQLDRTIGQDGKSRPARFVFNGGNLSNPRPNTIATPSGVCRFLYDLISPVYKIRTILDPCAGNGNLTRPWRGRNVIQYEIAWGKDFFSGPSRIAADLVLCNPPFNNGDGEARFVPELFLR